MSVKVKQNGHKLLPQDKEAEAALLGSLMIDPNAIYEVAAMLPADSFYNDANGLVYQTMLDLSARSEPLDPIGIMAELRRYGHADIGDGQRQAESYLIDMLNRATSSLHATNYAKIVSDMSTRRKIISASQKAATMAWDESEPLSEISETVQGLIFDATNRHTGRGLSHISVDMASYLNVMTDRFDNPVEVSGMATGYTDLDKVLNGLKPQQLVIVAGRPGMGKTALQIGMCDMMSVTRGKRGAFFSLEMSKTELIDRIIGRRINVNLQNLQRGNLTEKEQARFYQEYGRVSQAPIFITDLPGMTPAAIRSECLRQVADTGLDYVVVDYLQLITVSGGVSRYEQVSTAARSMKNLAKELDVPVILASQLNRSLEARGDKRPQLSDLRDSGEIEEAANVVLMLYRDEYYNQDSSKWPNQGEVSVSKHRNGPSGMRIDLYWQAETASYRNLERQHINL